jgi:ribonucleoside-diphosphate reductase alpha chain
MNDYYWLNENSRLFLSRGYLSNGVEPEDRIKEIAENAESILKISGFAKKFQGYMARGFYSLSTPVWSNFGNNRGLPVSCFGSYISDDMCSILSTVSEVGMMSKMGGGTSAYFGELRHRGSKIGTEYEKRGESSGPVHFMELFDKVSTVISQGSTRRGAFAAYLPIEHKDAKDFLKIQSKGSTIQDMSFGVTITDEFMNSMLDGDSEKRKLWASVIKKRYETGYPYIFFTDNVNNNAPQVYKDKNLKISASNLCVTGDQRVPSNYGILTAKELCEIGTELSLFDNDKIVKSSPMKLIEKDADVFKITLENGMTHTVTSYHKVSVFNKITKITEDIACKDLKIGDSIAVQTSKGIFGDKNMPKEAFLLGLYQADGTQHKDTIMLDFWENDFDILEEVQSYHDYVCDNYKTQFSSYNGRAYNNPKFHDCVTREGSHLKKRLASKALKKSLNFEKGYAPEWIWCSDEETQWQYIRGLYFADGTVFKSTSNDEPIQISLASIDKEFLREIQLILANLGMQSSIRILRKEGKVLLPKPNLTLLFDKFNTPKSITSPTAADVPYVI